MTAHAPKFAGPPIASVLQLVFKSDDVPDLGFDPEKLQFRSFDEMLAWHSSLGEEQLKYLSSVDKFVANLVPGETVNLSSKVKPENTVQFYRSLFYVLQASKLINAVSFSEDLKQIRMNH